MINISWFENIVTEKCMGTDTSFETVWNKYKDYHYKNQSILLYFALPIIILLLMDSMYINMRKTAKSKKKKGKKKASNKVNPNGKVEELEAFDLDQREEKEPMVGI